MELISCPASSATHFNNSSPYFLRNGDNTRVILVSQVLSGENYSSRRRSMKKTPSAKNKLGSLPKPSPSISTYSLWIRCNDMVGSWLLDSISKELVNSVLSIDTAGGIWKDLHEHLSKGNGPSIFQIFKRLCLVNSLENIFFYF